MDKTCDLCPKACNLSLGQIGFCGARKNEGGEIISLSYGKFTSIALDPIEKKPLSFYKSGSKVLSLGSFGCNMACPFCQNYEIARAKVDSFSTYDLTVDDLIGLALRERARGNIGIAFTYNEPLINYEYILETAKSCKEHKLDLILVTNGQINSKYLDQLVHLVDAWNIDLKAFSTKAYRELGGDFETTLNTIKKASAYGHLEVTSLIVPGISDDLDAFEKEVDFLASLNPDIPLHLTRYFPRYKYDRSATDIGLLIKMKEMASKKLNRVVLGNV